MAKFRLTLLFLLFSLAITTATVFILNRVSTDVGERSLMNISTKMAETDAQLIGGALEIMASAEVSDGETVITVAQLIESMSSEDPLAVLLNFIGPEILEPLSVVSISLIAPDGTRTWSIGSDASLAGDREIFERASIDRAFQGETVSALDRSITYMTPQDEEATGDVVTSLVPLESQPGEPPLVMSITRDMSDVLESEIENTRVAMFKVTLASLGGLFVVLLAFIVAIDMHIWRSNQRLIQEKLLHAESERDRTELMRLNEAKDRFISTVSHELKTPLTTIMGYAEILHRNRNGNLIDQQVEQIATMRKAGWRLDLLIDDMLDISRIESGRMTFDKTRFDIEEIMDDLEKSLQPVVEQRDQKLEFEYSGPKVPMVADRSRIIQCISNLVTNASKYSETGSTVSVSTRVEGDSLIAIVQDTGIGITEEDQEKLFTLFFRADNKQTRAQAGLGLGLFITSAIIHGHGGSLHVESEFGVGTKVTVRLPGVEAEGAIAPARSKTRLKPTESRLKSLKSA